MSDEVLLWDRGCSPLDRLNAGKDCVSGARKPRSLGGKILVMQMAVVVLEQRRMKGLQLSVVA